jgi:DNA-binding PadR family transcriptional regulator
VLACVYQFLIYQNLIMADDSLTALLPLSPAVFHILLALADDDRHGYAIMRDIEQRTDGVVRVGPGMLYGSVKWLLRDGFIEETSRRVRTGGDERRRYYRLTASGRALLKAEAARLEAAVGLARARRVLARKV